MGGATLLMVLVGAAVTTLSTGWVQLAVGAYAALGILALVTRRRARGAEQHDAVATLLLGTAGSIALAWFLLRAPHLLRATMAIGLVIALGWLVAAMWTSRRRAGRAGGDDADGEDVGEPAAIAEQDSAVAADPPDGPAGPEDDVDLVHRVLNAVSARMAAETGHGDRTSGSSSHQPIQVPAPPP